MDIKDNKFYRKKDITQALGIYPQFKDFAKNKDEYVTLKGGIGASSYVLSGSTPPQPNFGEGTLTDGFFRILASSANLSNAAEIPKVEIYKIKKGIPIEEGSMTMATGTDGTYTAGEDLYVAGVYMDGESVWLEENFDGADKSLGAVIPIRSIGTSTVTFEDSYMDIGDAVSEIFIGGGNFPWGGNKTENLRNYFSDPGNKERIPVKPESSKRFRGKWVPRVDRRSKKQQWEIYAPVWKFKDIKGQLSFAKTQPVSTTIETTVEASKNNTLFDTIKMTPNQNNPFQFNTTDKPMIYSTVELTTAKKETGGQALRVYHNWSHVSDVKIRKQVEAFFSAGMQQGVDNPEYIPAEVQVAQLGMSNIPLPAIIDQGYSTPGQGWSLPLVTGAYDQSASLPEITFRMNISKLPPNIMTTCGNLESAAKYWSNISQTNDDTLSAPVGFVLGQASTSGNTPTGRPEYGFYQTLSGAGFSGTAGFGKSNSQYMGGTGANADPRAYTYQRGIVCVLSTRPPMEDENTVDKFILGLYNDSETFGGLQFMSYANPVNDGTGMPGTAEERMPSAPGGGPWNTGSIGSQLVNVDAPSVWIKPIPIVPNVDAHSFGTASTPVYSGAANAGEGSKGYPSLGNNGGLLAAIYNNATGAANGFTLARTKLIYHESPGYWLNSKVSQSAGFDAAASTKWKWSTQNWARVVKDSWFDMKLVFSPFASCSAQQYDAVSGGADGNWGSTDLKFRRNVAVRAYFDSDFDIKTAQTVMHAADFDNDPGGKWNSPSKKFIPFVNIPMFNKTRASEAAGTGFALINEDYWPTHISWWFMNYRWVGSENAPTDGEEPLWLGGDNILQPNGADMELEAYIDNVQFKHWNTEMDNASVGRGDMPSMLKIKNYAVETPKLYQAVSGYGELGSGFINSGCFTNASTGYNVLIGLKDKDDLPYTDNGSSGAATLTNSGGFFLWNSFSTQQFKNLLPLKPANVYMSQSGRDTGEGEYPIGRMGNQLGPGGSSFGTSTSPTGWQEWAGSGMAMSQSFSINDQGVEEGNYPTSGAGLNISSSGFYMATGANDYLSVDGQSQKGLMGLAIVSGVASLDTDSMGARPLSGSECWVKREHILASARIIGVPADGDGFQNNYLTVDKPEIFNVGDPDEEYIIYKYFTYPSSAAYYKFFEQPAYDVSSATCRGLNDNNPLKLSQDKSRDGDTFFFDVDSDISLADDLTTKILTKKSIGSMWISPKRFWIHLAYGSANSPDVYTKPLYTPRTYESVCLLNYSSSADLSGASAISGGTQLGTTTNEYKYTYAAGEVGEKGKSGVYQRAWNLTPMEGSDIIINQDYGFGSFDSGTNDGGQLGIEPAIINTSADPSRYIEFPLSGLVDKDKLGQSDNILLKLGLSDEIDSSDVVIYGDEYTGVTDYKPHIIWEYSDELPKLSEFKVAPASEILDEDINLYELSTESLNSVRFTWKEEGDDMWYRMLFIDTGSIDNKYHKAILHAPLNESPTTIGSGATNYWYNYTESLVTSGAIVESGNWEDTKADIEGLAGYAVSYNATGGLAGNAGHSHIPQTDNTSVSGTDYTVVIHAIPGTNFNADDFIFSYGNGYTTGMDIYKKSTGYIVARHSGALLTSSTKLRADNETPVSIVVIHRAGSSDGKDLKLYVNGALEDYYAGTLSNIDVAGVSGTDIGGKDNSYQFCGKIEEVIVYTQALWVPESEDELILNTEDLSYDVHRSNTYQAKMFSYDYHNIRGTSDTQIASTNQIAWKVTKA